MTADPGQEISPASPAVVSGLSLESATLTPCCGYWSDQNPELAD